MSDSHIQNKNFLAVIAALFRTKQLVHNLKKQRCLCPTAYKTFFMTKKSWYKAAVQENFTLLCGIMQSWFFLIVNYQTIVQYDSTKTAAIYPYYLLTTQLTPKNTTIPQLHRTETRVFLVPNIFDACCLRTFAIFSCFDHTVWLQKHNIQLVLIIQQ